jgi:hypothetical protein
MAVQVDPIKPTLKAPGTNRLILKYDKLISIFAFNFKLRRYTKGNKCCERHSTVRPGAMFGPVTIMSDAMLGEVTIMIGVMFG